MPEIEIGVIGGTGIYDAQLLKNVETVNVETKYGEPSDAITCGTYEGRRIGFIPRHGRGHVLAPHMINYRANIRALADLGASRIIAASAVGSLQEEIEPGHLALPDQFIDNTRSRTGSFTQKGDIIHISVADPFCPELQGCVRRAAAARKATLHGGCTYVCIEGPRFSTKAESNMYRGMGAHIIGMTLVPECQLAREARVCYASVALVTDYDVWAEKPVTAKEVADTISKNAQAFKDLLSTAIREIPTRRACRCSAALDEATL